MICQALFSREKIKMSPASVVTGPLKTDRRISQRGLDTLSGEATPSEYPPEMFLNEYTAVFSQRSKKNHLHENCTYIELS